MRTGAFDPPEIPPAFWYRDDVRQALRDRDMGTLFALLRRRAGLSQTRISTATGLGQGRVSEIVHGTRAVAAVHVFQRIADGLGMPPAARQELGIAAPADAPAAPDATDCPPGLLELITAARRVDRSVIAAMEAETHAIRLQDRRVGAPAVAGKLEAHLRHVEGSFRHSLRPGARQALAAALADASALAGWQAIDMGRLPRAWDHFERAVAAARESGDPSLLAHAAAEQAYVLLDLRQPLDALAMVQAATAGAGSTVPARMLAWLHAAEAEMAASADDPGTCRRALDRAARILPPGPGDPGLPYLSLDAAHLARWRGNCLVTAGDPAAAADLGTALASMDPAFTRARAGLHGDLAAARHAAGDFDEAGSHLAAARQLAEATGSARLNRRVSALAARLAA
jgi:transcriptional regulator with XRE-family HTH domain